MSDHSLHIDHKGGDRSIQPVSRAAERLEHTSQQLLQIMDEQIEAVKLSDTEKINHLSESYVTLLSHFSRDEERLAEELKKLSVLRLERLKSSFPEAESRIESWRVTLGQTGKELLRKHNQLKSLLEFAVGQNSRLMQSIYRMSNENSSGYGPDGEPSAVSPGTAVNHKV